jgi:drug/metabolite transporter (DMT)-like permease
MEPLPRISGQRAGVTTAVVTLAGLVLYVFLPDPVRAAGAAVLGLGGLAVVACAAARLHRTRAHAAPVTAAAVSALGLLGATVYLHSLADEPTAIPLGGFGVLLVSFVGLLVTIAVLARGGADDGAGDDPGR